MPNLQNISLMKQYCYLFISLACFFLSCNNSTVDEKDELEVNNSITIENDSPTSSVEDFISDQVEKEHVWIHTLIKVVDEFGDEVIKVNGLVYSCKMRFYNNSATILSGPNQKPHKWNFSVSENQFCIVDIDGWVNKEKMNQQICYAASVEDIGLVLINKDDDKPLSARERDWGRVIGYICSDNMNINYSTKL